MGIVQHYSRKQLGPLSAHQKSHNAGNLAQPIPDDDDTDNRLSKHNYGSSSPPPHTFQHVSTPQWSISSDRSHESGHPVICATESAIDNSGSMKHFPSDSFGNEDRKREETNL